MKKPEKIDGIVRHAFFMPNTREEEYHSLFEEDLSRYMEEVRYDINEKGEIVITKR